MLTRGQLGYIDCVRSRPIDTTLRTPVGTKLCARCRERRPTKGGRITRQGGRQIFTCQACQ